MDYGYTTNWEEEFKKWDNNIDLIKSAFKNDPSEFTFYTLKSILKKDFIENLYISASIVEKYPNIYIDISDDLRKNYAFAIAYVKSLDNVSLDSDTNSKIKPKKSNKKSNNSNISAIDYLHESFKTDLDFLMQIASLEIDFKTLESFFDNRILTNENFLIAYLVKNYEQFEYLPNDVRSNKNIALHYGVCKKETNLYYRNILTDLALPEKLNNDKDLILEIAKLNLNNNHNISDKLIKDNKFLKQIIEFQPKLVKAIPEDNISENLILELLNININVFDYLESEQMLIPEVFDFICKKDITKLSKVENFGNYEQSILNLKKNHNLLKCINFFDEETFSNEILKFINTHTIVINDSTNVKSDIKSLYYVNGFCTFELGYNRNCYLSEDVAGVLSDETLSEFLSSEDSWSDYIWENSWHDIDSIYHKYGIIEPATDLKLPNGDIIPVSLDYKSPNFDNLLDCFDDSSAGDFIQIASSDEKAYGWDQWKRYTLEVKPGIFNINNIEVEFERDIVSGYTYNYPDGTSDSFEENEDISTSGKGFTSELYFNNGTKLHVVDIDDFREALNNEGIDLDDIEEVKQFALQYYNN